MGERVEEPVDHPVIRPSINAVAATYDLAVAEPELATAKSQLTGERVNRFAHIAGSADDVVMQNHMQRRLGQLTGTCFQRCVGMDAINSLWSVTFEMDRDNGTDYHRRLRTLVEHVQRENLVVGGAMTDAKGDRSRGPSEQDDPDLFVRVVRRTERGLVLRGAKMHQTGCINSHWLIVMPTMRLGEADRDYAVVAAVPVERPGADVRLRPAVVRHAGAGRGHHRSGQRALRRPGGDGRARRRRGAVRARVHGRRDQLRRRPGRALHHVPPAQLRVQDRPGRRAHRRRRHHRRDERRRSRLPRARQAGRDGPSQRDHLRLRHRLVAPVQAAAGGQLGERSTAGECVQTQRHTLPLRDGAAGAGPRRWAGRHIAVGERAEITRYRADPAQVSEDSSGRRTSRTACACCVSSRT